MTQGANALSRNPNICASCSSLADGEGAQTTSLPVMAPQTSPLVSTAPEPQCPTLETDEKVLDWHA